jgi:VanZ family protein
LPPVLWTATIFYFSLKPSGEDQNEYLDFDGSDKLFHFVCYAIWYLSWIWFLNFKNNSLKFEKHVFAILVLIGIGIEYLQDFMQLGRDFDSWDMVANGLGVLLGFIIFRYK